jgi:hypothetical protein
VRAEELSPATIAMLGAVAAADHLLEVVRLSRVGCTAGTDATWRQRVVITAAVTGALAADVRDHTTTATTDLYRRIAARPKEV